MNWKILWYGKQSPQWSASHAERSFWQLERDLFPWIGDRAMTNIHAMELLAALQKVEERGAIETTNRVLMLAGRFGTTGLLMPLSNPPGSAKILTLYRVMRYRVLCFPELFLCLNHFHRGGNQR